MNTNQYESLSETETNGSHLKELCAKLQEERDRLQLEVNNLRAERDQYLKAIYVLTEEPVEFDKETLLAQVGKEKPLREFIADLKARG